MLQMLRSKVGYQIRVSILTIWLVLNRLHTRETRAERWIPRKGAQGEDDWGRVSPNHFVCESSNVVPKPIIKVKADNNNISWKPRSRFAKLVCGFQFSVSPGAPYSIFLSSLQRLRIRLLIKRRHWRLHVILHSRLHLLNNIRECFTQICAFFWVSGYVIKRNFHKIDLQEKTTEFMWWTASEIESFFWLLAQNCCKKSIEDFKLS